MFHPIGSQPPSVYWRRRLMFLATLVLLVVLIILTVKALTGGDDTKSAAGTPSRSATSTQPPPSPRTTVTSSTSTAATSTAHSRSPSSSTSSSAAGTSSSSPAPPPACTASNLRVVAVPQHSSYRVNDHPVLQLQVTNVGSKPCVQDLADKQVELKVYNGESRVWGSHDCKVEPGSNPRTLAPGVPVLVAVSWSGLTSQSPCTGTRQRVGPGTYTLYGSLAGRTGHAGRFSIS